MRLASIPLPRRKILIVEDDADIRGFLQMLLARQGYETETADSGLTGLAAFAHFLPDVILLDMAMPDMDGFAFLARRREIDLIRNIPVIVLSAHDRQSDVVAAIQAGAATYVAKPFDNARLIASVNKLIGPAVAVNDGGTRVSW